MSGIFHPVYDWWLKANLALCYGKFLSMLKNHPVLIGEKLNASFHPSMMGGS